MISRGCDLGRHLVGPAAERQDCPDEDGDGDEGDDEDEDDATAVSICEAFNAVVN